GLLQRVRFEGEVPHRDVRSYFTHADVFVFPSIEETFGIPLLEAMGFDVPVVVSDCDLDSTYRGKCFNPFREICVNAAQYFNPFDPNSIAQCVHRILIDARLRVQLIAHGKERVKKYNLEHTTSALIRLFEGGV
ncbi:MAG: glycosyltransferase, partial [Anaerolineales bacterium]|nr:glycosyltransferase [Anaerolineales bacterium]